MDFSSLPVTAVSVISFNGILPLFGFIISLSYSFRYEHGDLKGTAIEPAIKLEASAR